VATGIIGSALVAVIFLAITIAMGIALERAEERVDFEKMILIAVGYVTAIAVLTLMVFVRTPTKGF
jgi:hypothetical protein